ncbi:MAG TPA: hypothetical protein VHB92_11355 [Humibacter sp.]|nr:hypothetical protein [Humibacter sp.]
MTGLQVVTATGPVQAAVPTPPIDLANPTATVNDPAAGLAPVNTECVSGQVDINTASASQIQQGLGISSGPTVQRLIAARPWLKGADLSSVPGIGPSAAEKMASKTCATQPTLPVPTPLACTSSSQVDVQTATAAAISSGLKLPMNTAQGLISARPLPQDLTQVETPRVDGLSDPKLQKLLKDGSICVTPAPMLAGGAAWRWATPQGGAVVTRDGFALIVPPGRITDPAGAYISVLPEDPGEDGLPRIDASIHGNWNVGTSSVAVQAPWTIQDPTVRPAVFHDAASGTTLSVGNGTSVRTVNGQPSVTSVAYSLSQFEFGATSCTPASTSLPAPLCLQNLTDGSLHNAWLQQAQATGAASAQSLKPKPACPDTTTSVSLTHTDGGLPFGIVCGVEAEDDSTPAGVADWTMTNAAYSSILDGLASAGVVYEYDATDRDSTHVVSGGVEDNPIVATILKGLSGDHLLFPGQNLVTSKQPSFLVTEDAVHPSVAATIDWESIDELVGSFADMASNQVQNIYGAVEDAQSCAHMDDNAVGCVKALLEQAVGNADALAAKGSLASKILGSMKKVFKAVAASEIIASVGQAFVFSFIGGTDVVLTNTPNAPTQDHEGRPVLPDCLSHNDTNWLVDENCQGAFYTSIQDTPGSGGGTTGLPPGKIARDSQGHAYFVNLSAQTIQPIADGGTYLCLAKHYIVDWEAHIDSYDKALAVVSTAATCDGSLPDTRPVNSADNLGAYVILRQADGSSWVVVPENGHEYRYPISTGHEFECWVNPDPSSGAGESDVWDQVTPDQLALYPIEADLDVSNCPGF